MEYVKTADGMDSHAVFFLILPWLPWGDRQAVWFNLAEQKFHVFGLTIWPQDLTLLAALFMIAAFALFFLSLPTWEGSGAGTPARRQCGPSSLSGLKKSSKGHATKG